MSAPDRMLAFYDEELPTRAHRPLGADRTARLASFVDLCRHESIGSVLDDEHPHAPGGHQHRTDEQFRQMLAEAGTVEAFETWEWFEDGGHYQCARVRVG